MNVRATDPNTSNLAAESIQHYKTKVQQQLIELLKEQGDTGITSQEAEVILQLPVNTVSPRWAELVRLGVVEDSGQRRLTRARRQAIVWRLTTRSAKATPEAPTARQSDSPTPGR